MKIRRLILCFLLAVLTIGQAHAIIWDLKEDGTLEIQGTGELPDYNTFGSNRPWNGIDNAKVKKIVVGYGVTHIGNWTFSDYQNCASVELPSTLTSIGEGAFYICSSLRSIDLPSKLTYIGEGAFDGCRFLTEVHADMPTPPTIEGDLPTNATFYVSLEDFEAYEAAGLKVKVENRYVYYTTTDGKLLHPYSTNGFGARYSGDSYSKGQGRIEFDGPVTAIGNNAFKDCITLSSFTMPGSVTSIGQNAFYNCTALTSVAILGSVKSIGAYSFYGCEGLTSFTMPRGVTSIDTYAFYGCRSLTSITIPGNVASIGSYAFNGCSGLMEIHVYITTPITITADVFGNVDKSKCKLIVPPSSLQAYKKANVWKEFGQIEPSQKYIYYTSSNEKVVTPLASAFEASIVSNTYSNGQGCIAFADDVTKIGSNAFKDCTTLVSITIPSSVTSIGEKAFYNCIALNTFTVPEGVSSIDAYAFYGCSSLTSITISSGVSSIGAYAFYGCDGLSEINASMATPPTITADVFGNVNKSTCKLFVPESYLQEYKIADYWKEFAQTSDYIYYTSSDGKVVSPLSSAFGANIVSNTYSNGQGRISFDASVTTIGSNAFKGCSNLSSINISNSVTSIGQGAFSGCSNLTALTIPNSVTSIAGSAFFGCSGLTSITIPSSVTSIGNNAFYQCSSLTSITIPSNVTSIGEGAFRSCSSLTSITIPSSVTSIGSSAFSGCIKLKSVTIERTTPCTAGTGILSSCSSLTAIYVPAASVDSYKTAEGWSTYAGKIFAVGTPLFELNYTSSDGKVVSPLSSAFGANILSNTYSNNQGCISFDASVTTIGSNAFKGCSTLASLTIPNSVTSIGDYAFQNCSGLTALTIPNSVTSIGRNAFSGCSGLTALTIPNSVTSIGQNAFYQCSGLTSITIPNSVTSIELGAFKSCTGLTSIVIPSGVTSIGGALISSPRLTSIIVEESNKVFDSRGNCNAIIETATNMLIQGCETTTIPNNVTSIGEEAFDGCKGLTALTIPNSVTSIGRNAFTGCSGLTALTIPNSVTSIGNSAFVSCTGLTSVTIPSSVTSIGTYAFRWCSGLNSVTVEGATPCTFASYVFAGCTALEKIYVPAGTAEVYKAAEGWSAYADKIVALPQEGGTEGDDEGGTEDNDDIIESTDISTMDYVLFIPSTEVNVGSESELQLNLKNATEDITAFECKVYLPEGVEWAYTIDKRGNKVYNLPTFNEDRTDASYHTINAVKQMSDGGYYVIVYSGSNEYILETEGTILNLPVVVSEEAVAGDYNIFVKGIVITDTDANQTLIDQTVSKLTIVDYTLGDANNDGMINVTDVVTVIAYMLEDNPASFVFKAGDVNADGQINVTDIVGIINIMLADDSPAAASARRGQILRQALAAAAKGNSLEIVPFTVAQGTTSKSVTLDLVNPGDEFTAFECKVYLPEGIDWAYTVDKRGKIVYTLPTFNSEADRTDATYHTINAIKKMSDGGYYIIVYSGNNKVILDEEGAVLNLPLTFDENLAESVYDIRIGDIVLSRTNTTQELLDDYTTSVVVGSPSAKSLVLHGDFTADAVKELNTALASNTSVCSIDFSEAFALADAEVKTANENLLVYVGEGQKVANTCNVVAAGVCANLVLTDGKPFGPAKTFTVKAGEYGRKLAADEYATIVLPFAPDAETLKGYTFYELTAAEAAMLTFDEVTAPEAGMPYIVIADGSATKLTAKAESTVAIEAASTEADGWTMTGTYESVVFTNADELASLYCISGNQFKQATSKLTMNPFRAYFVGDGSAKSIQLRGSDGSTRIIDLEGEQAAGQLYDVLGRQVDHAAQGIYIQNGKKVLVK